MKESLFQKIILWFLVIFIGLPFLGICFLFLRLIGRIKIIGKENLISVLKERNVIFAFNHPSMLEVIWAPTFVFLYSVFHYFPRSLVGLLGYVPWSFPDVKITKKLFFLRFLRCISVRENRTDFGALNKAVQVLKNGGWLCIAPEGGRTSKGTEFLESSQGARIRRPRGGIGRMVRGCSSKVLPIWVETTEDISPVTLKNWLFQVGRKITFVIGIPLDFSLLQAFPDSRETWEVISQEVAKWILALSEKVPK